MEGDTINARSERENYLRCNNDGLKHSPDLSHARLKAKKIPLKDIFVGVFIYHFDHIDY